MRSDSPSANQKRKEKVAVRGFRVEGVSSGGLRDVGLRTKVVRPEQECGWMLLVFV
jgi:hypothetical protein